VWVLLALAIIGVLAVALVGVTTALWRVKRDLRRVLERLGVPGDERGASRSLYRGVIELQRRAVAAEAELEPLRDAVNETALGIVLVDDLGSITFANPVAETVLAGRSGEAVIRRELLDVLDEARQTEAQVLRDVDLYSPLRRLVRIRAVPFDNGGAVAFVRDLSEQVRVEALRRDFVANAGHELKTPLGALAVLAETLGEVEDEDQRRRLSTRLSDEARRLGRVVDDILVLGAIEGEPAPFELSRIVDVVADARDRVALTADGAGVTIHYDVPNEDSWVEGNRDQLVSAVANLLDNAIKYSQGPGSVVTCRAGVDGDEITISVHDHGIGIQEAHIDRVFERFYRVDRARSRDSGGTGLGLSIVRNVARTHGGSVSVESKAGEGSTFEIRLPIAKGGDQ
jgi:two-component system, OmpR family, sensor histidine kinase SenX3